MTTPALRLPRGRFGSRVRDRLAQRRRTRRVFLAAANAGGLDGPQLDALARALTDGERAEESLRLTRNARRLLAMASHPSMIGGHPHARTLGPTFMAASRALHVADEVLDGGLS